MKAQLRTLFERFGPEALPQNPNRARLAALALLQGIVTARDQPTPRWAPPHRGAAAST